SRELTHRHRVINVAALRDIRKRNVVIHQQDQHLAFGRTELQATRHPLCENRARFRMRPGPDRFASVMQQQRQIKDKGICEFFEKVSVLDKLWIFGSRQRIELIDTDQSMFVGGITVKKLVLHQAGKLSKLRNILSEKIEPVH